MPESKDTPNTKFQEKYETEAQARANAVLHHGQTNVVIIQSNGAFYLEDADSSFIRSWEREVYSGLGRKATTVTK